MPAAARQHAVEAPQPPLLWSAGRDHRPSRPCRPPLGSCLQAATGWVTGAPGPSPASWSARPPPAITAAAAGGAAAAAAFAGARAAIAVAAAAAAAVFTGATGTGGCAEAGARRPAAAAAALLCPRSR